MSANNDYSTDDFKGDMRGALQPSFGASASSSASVAQAPKIRGTAWHGRSVQPFIPITRFEKALSARLNEVLGSSLSEVLTGLVIGYLSDAEILKKLVQEATNDPGVVDYVVPGCIGFKGDRKMVLERIRAVTQNEKFQNNPADYMQKWNSEREKAQPDPDIDIQRSYITKFLQRNGILPAPPSRIVITSPSNTVSQVLVASAEKDPEVHSYGGNGVLISVNRDAVLTGIRAVAAKKEFQADPAGYMQRWNARCEAEGLIVDFDYLESEQIPRLYVTKHLKERRILLPPTQPKRVLQGLETFCRVL